MLFAGCIMCATAGACLPSRRVLTPSGSLLCFYRCHYALTVPGIYSMPVCGRFGVLAIQSLVRNRDRRTAKSRKAYSVGAQMPRPN